MTQDPKQDLDIGFEAAEVNTVSTLFKASLKMFFDNFWQIAFLVTVVYLPVELIKNILLFGANQQDNWKITFRVESFISAVISPLLIPALVYMLVYNKKNGEYPPLTESLKWGMSKWGRVFGVNFISGAAIIGGLILLVVPGIMFAVWFSLAAVMVSIEGLQQEHPLEKSRALTKGHRWMLFFTYCSGYLLFIAAAILVGVVEAIFDISNAYLTTFSDVIFDVMLEFLTVTSILAYLHFRKTEAAVKTSAEPIKEAGSNVPKDTQL